jgi:hypothetical protein
MRTYKGLTSDHIKSYGRLNRVAQQVGRNDKAVRKEPFGVFIKIYKDQLIAEEENSEIFDYQLKRL